MGGVGTTLRLPYSVQVTSDGELSVDITNEGALQLSIYNPKTNNTLQAGTGEMATITAYEGDYGYDLQFVVSDVDGDPFNLSGASIKFKMCLPTATTLKVDGTVTIVSATDGQCAYTTASADFDTAGTYSAELEITVSGKVYTIGGIDVEVIKDLPRCS